MLDSTSSSRPTAFVHVDLDGLWTLAGCYGYPEGDSFRDDPVFDVGLPRLTALLGDLGLRATFFISGRDAEVPEKAEWLRRLAAAHELANHGWGHDLDYGVWEVEALTDALKRANEVIETAGGAPPLGFRAPGYASGPAVLESCARAGLRYDGSALPTPWGFLLRRLAGGIRRRVGREMGIEHPPIEGHTSEQYGHGERPGIHWVETPAGSVLRLPLAVSPLLRLPLHASLGMHMGAARVKRALRKLAARGEPITYLLHGLDVMGAEDLAGRLPKSLLKSRGFSMPLRQKLEFLRTVLTELNTIADVTLTRDWIQSGAPTREKATK